MNYKEIEKITGIPVRRIRFFGDQGLLSFEEQFPGRGVGRQYTWKNLLELMIVKELSNNSVELATIKKAMIFIRENFCEVLEKQYYIGDRPNYYLTIYPSGAVKVGGERRDAVPMKELFNEEASILIVDLNKLVEAL